MERVNVNSQERENVKNSQKIVKLERENSQDYKVDERF